MLFALVQKQQRANRVDTVQRTLHHLPVRLKRRKWLISLACAAIAFALFLTLTREHQPEYEGHKLSEWLEQCRKAVFAEDRKTEEEARTAVRNIGSNALPCLLKWIDHEPPAWRMSLRTNLPTFISNRRMVYRWLGEDEADRRASYAGLGFQILGTNAFGAVPALDALMKDTTKPRISERAIYALGRIGEPAIPVLRAGLADSNQTNRRQIFNGFRLMALNHGTNVCLPIVLEALNHEDTSVRIAATNALKALAPGAVFGSSPK